MFELKNIIRKHKYDFYGIFLRQYPEFILNDKVNRFTHPPVFVFHSLGLEYGNHSKRTFTAATRFSS